MDCHGVVVSDTGTKLVVRIKTLKNRNASKPTGLYWSLRFNAVKSSHKTVTNNLKYTVNSGYIGV